MLVYDIGIITQANMFLLTITTIMLFFSRQIRSFPTILDDRVLDEKDFRPFNSTFNSTPSNIEYSNSRAVKTIRIYLVIGYAILLLIVVYVCTLNNTNKKSTNYKSIP